jgi:hypothetical protein
MGEVVLVLAVAVMFVFVVVCIAAKIHKPDERRREREHNNDEPRCSAASRDVGGYGGTPADGQTIAARRGPPPSLPSVVPRDPPFENAGTKTERLFSKEMVRMAEITCWNCKLVIVNFAPREGEDLCDACKNEMEQADG